jgi:hypothetical protein
MEQQEKKVCTRCGIKKPLDEFYMVKYKDAPPKHRYSVCKTCTRIEQRRRRLLEKDPTNPELDKINRLYEMHRAAGRSVPEFGKNASSSISNDIDELLRECGGNQQ